MILRIPHAIWIQMLCFARQALPDEITGIGLIESEPDPDGYVRELTVKEIRIVPQRTSPGYCEFEDEALHGVYLDYIEEDRINDVQKLRFRWHSHGIGSVFFSTTDTRDIDENNLNADWLVSLVINSRGDRIARLDNFTPFRNSVPLEIEIVEEIPIDLLTACRDQIAEMVRPYEGHITPQFADKVDSGWNGFDEPEGGEFSDPSFLRPDEVV